MKRILILSLIVSAGCSKAPTPAPRVHLRPEMKAVSVEKRTIVRVSGQPGFIEAYEQTSIFPKISGFIDRWYVDIGASITRGMVLAHLDVPDLLADYEEKKAEVALDEVRIQVAQENWNIASAQVDEAKANLGKFKAEVERWTADYERIHVLFLNKSVDATVDDESRKHMQSSIAEEKAAEVGILVAEATRGARKADVDAAKARAKVARATEKRLAAMVGYTNILAPYNGVVVTRNVNTGDFAQPSAGDPSALRNNPGVSRVGSHPLYVVARRDKVRIFLDVPEMEANGIHAAGEASSRALRELSPSTLGFLGSPQGQGSLLAATAFIARTPGSKAHVSIQAVDNMELSAEVIRTSWALNGKSRTLRAEIDIPNPDGRILPNMYAFGTVELTRVDVWAIPLRAIFRLGNQDYCYVFENGKAVQLPVQVGIDDGSWVEVTKKRIKTGWVPFDGTERTLIGELSQLSDGQTVRIEASSPTQK